MWPTKCPHSLHADCRSGYVNLYPSSNVLFGETRWPSNISDALSWLRTLRKTNSGIGSFDHRFRAPANASENWRLVAASGATALSTPETWSLAMAWFIMPATSSTWTHGNHWRPEPNGPPRPKKYGRIMFCTIPPSRPSARPEKYKMYVLTHKVLVMTIDAQWEGM